MEIYEEDGIIYTIHSEDPEVEVNRMFNELWLRDAYQRYSYIEREEIIKKRCKYIFLTINPNPQITLLEFIRCMEKLMSKTWMTQYIYVFEQRGETLEEVGKGFHFHAIIEKPSNKSYQHMVRELSSGANKVCDTSNFHFYNLKNIDENEKERKIKYITDMKADPAKHLKQEMDIIFRKNNNLLSYYNVGII